MVAQRARMRVRYGGFAALCRADRLPVEGRLTWVFTINDSLEFDAALVNDESLVEVELVFDITPGVSKGEQARSEVRT